MLTLLASIVLLVVQGPQPAFLYTLMCLDDTFAHLLFWSSFVRMARSVSMPSYRIVGLGIGVNATHLATFPGHAARPSPKIEP